MRIDDLKSAYRKSESIHLLLSDVLDNLDEKTQIKYNKKKKAVVFVAVLLTILFVLSTTVVAAKTDFFGLYSNKKGSQMTTFLFRLKHTCNLIQAQT